MTPERWRRIESLYAAALEHPPDQRADRLSSWCAGDESLRLEVAGLLEAHDAEPAFIETPLMERLAARLAEHYDTPATDRVIGRCRLVELIGRGGMGQVYRAWDIGLEREVALKLVRPEELDEHDATEQLLHEARTAARLSHPNICTVHEVGETDGLAFIVMELVEGRTLAEIVREAPLDDARAVRIALQIADALVHAHQRGVLHRDLKSANVAVGADDAVKVLDFGLACRLNTDGVEMLTRVSEGSIGTRDISGTLAYMAPELLRGEPADVRSDLWAMGVMLVEMLTGALPFEGATPLELASVILCGSPRPLPARTHPHLEAIVRRCLAKDRGERFQHAREVRDALAAVREDGAGRAAPHDTPALQRPAVRGWRWRGLASVASALLLVSASVLWLGLSHNGVESRLSPAARADVAVLPVQLRGVPTELNYLSMAITDALTGALATTRAVSVRPVDAVAAYQNVAGRRYGTIGNGLAVDHLVIGTLYGEADVLRLNLELVDSRRETVTWGQNFPVRIEELSRDQALIARALMTAMHRPLAQPPRGRTAPRSADAEMAYLQARAALAGNRQGDPLKAVAAFERVLALDAGYAPAYAGLAIASARVYRSAGPAALDQWAARAKDAASRALELDPALAEAHEAIASVYRYNESDWARVIEESQRALALDWTRDVPHHNMAVAFYHLGLFTLSERASISGATANPGTRWEQVRNLGRAALYAGRFGVARDLLERARAEVRGRPSWILAEAYFYTGDWERADRALRALYADEGILDRQRAGASLAAMHAKLGHERLARDLIDRTLALDPTDHHVAFRLGTAFAQLHERERAMSWLRRAADSGFPCYPWFASDPLLTPLRDDPAYQSLLKKMRRDTALWEQQYSPLYSDVRHASDDANVPMPEGARHVLLGAGPAR